MMEYVKLTDGNTEVSFELDVQSPDKVNISLRPLGCDTDEYNIGSDIKLSELERIIEYLKIDQKILKDAS